MLSDEEIYQDFELQLASRSVLHQINEVMGNDPIPSTTKELYLKLGLFEAALFMYGWSSQDDWLGS